MSDMYEVFKTSTPKELDAFKKTLGETIASKSFKDFVDEL